MYVTSRYLVYGIQFISFMVLAEKLGPFNYGIWGFITMLLGYMRIINLGIGNSINVIIIQYKDNLQKIKNYIASSFAAMLILIAGLVIILIIYNTIPDIFGKYELGHLFYFILIIGALQYINMIFSNIFRARNYLFEVAFDQSIIPVIILLNVILVNEEYLIKSLVYSYAAANLLSFLIFYFRSTKLRGGHIKFSYIKKILGKGIFLFFYNSAFYLILTTSSTLVSTYFSVSEYGIYSFSYTLGHSILLLMEAFAFIIYPKVIDKLYYGDKSDVERTLRSVRINYISLSHGLMYIAIIVFPFFLRFFPKFENSLLMLNMMVLTIILSTNSFGYNTLLIARNKEKLCAAISCSSLILNIITGFILIKVLHVPFQLCVCSIMLSYVWFAIACSWFCHKMLYGSYHGFFKNTFPLELLIPFFSAVIISVFRAEDYLWVPLIIFIVLNHKIIIEIYNTLKRIIQSPNIINIKHN